MVETAIRDKCSYITFNNYTQIASLLNSVGIKLEKEHNANKTIDTYIDRRHKIVHEADKNESKGSGQFKTSAINTQQLNKWIAAVEGLVEEIETKL